MKVFLSLLFTTLFLQTSLAENSADSLLQLIENAATPEQRIDIWASWANHTTKDNIIPLWENTDQAYLDAQQAMGEEEAQTWYFDLLGDLTILLQSNGYGEISTQIFDRMKSMADSVANGGAHQLQVNYYFYLGHFYYKQVDMEEAESLFLKGLEINKDLNIPELDFSLYNMLGLLNTFIDEQEKALQYYSKASKVADQATIANSRKMVLYKSMAYLYHILDEYERADSLYQLVMDSIHLVSRKTSQWRLRMDYALNLGHMGKVEQGLAQLEKLYPEIGDEESNDIKFLFCESYSEVLMLAGRLKEGTEWLVKSRAYYYQIQEARRKDEVQEWQAKYQSAEKEAQISTLEQQKSLSQSRMIIGGLIGLTLVGLLSFFLYANSSRRKRLALQLSTERELHNIRSKFFSSIAHDIRTPLALMLAPLERLDNTVQENAYKSDIQLARRNGVKLLDLFNQILEWNKADSKLLKLNPQIGRLDVAFNNLHQRFEQLAVEKGIKLTQQFKVTEDQFFLDYTKLDRITSNLLGNAIKYCEAGDGVTLTAEVITEVGEERLVVSVSDDGPGIAQEEQPQLFKRYFQGTEGKLKGGNGIGLALVKELVDIMNGEIQISSELGHGARFVVKLPVERGQAAGEDAPAVALAATSTPDQATILIVEDEPELAAFLVSTLSSKYKVLTASSATAGLELASSSIPNIIISDWMLPDYNGGELCRQLIANELTSHIPIIVLTAQNTEEHRKDALNAGAMAWMSKPFQISTLNRQIESILQHQQRSQEKWDTTPLTMVCDSKSAPVPVDPFIEKVQQAIAENYADEDLSMNRLAETLMISRVQLFRKVKNTIGKTPGKLLNEFRLQKAQELLRSSRLSVSEICFRVGFSDPSYFAKLYKQRFQVSPSQEFNMQ
ncbi:MAG: ATP-binding protein [Bacteroidota bacterium]